MMITGVGLAEAGVCTVHVGGLPPIGSLPDQVKSMTVGEGSCMAAAPVATGQRQILYGSTGPVRFIGWLSQKGVSP